MATTYQYRGPADRIAEAEGQKIIEDLQRVLPNFGVKQYFGSQPGIFPSYDHSALAFDEEGCCVGQLSSRWLEREGLRFLYLWTAMIATTERRSGLFKTLVSKHFAGVVADTKDFPTLVVTKTYNPVVYSMLLRLLDPLDGIHLYPTLESPTQDPELQGLAKRLAKGLCPDLEYRPAESVVVGGQGVLAPDYFPEMQKSDIPAVWSHFQKHVGRLDQLLCVVHVEAKAKALLQQVLAGLA
jgi:hypothetical protein